MTQFNNIIYIKIREQSFASVVSTKYLKSNVSLCDSKHSSPFIPDSTNSNKVSYWSEHLS